MEPADDDVDNFVDYSVTTKVKNIVEDIPEKSTKSYHDDV